MASVRRTAILPPSFALKRLAVLVGYDPGELGVDRRGHEDQRDNAQEYLSLHNDLGSDVRLIPVGS